MTSKVVEYKNIVITVSNEHFSSFAVYFNNVPGHFEPLGNVAALRGYATLEDGIQAGLNFVDQHQWEFVEITGFYSLYVRLWWDGDWGYSVRSEGSGANLASFKSREAALIAGREYIQKKISEFQKEISDLDVKKNWVSTSDLDDFTSFMRNWMPTVTGLSFTLSAIIFLLGDPNGYVGLYIVLLVVGVLFLLMAMSSYKTRKQASKKETDM